MARIIVVGREDGGVMRVLRILVASVVLMGTAAGQGINSAVDADLLSARGWIGQALFLRGFYGANELKYDAAGRVEGRPKVVDWTLAGMDVQGVERKGPGVLELDGVRVAIRYNLDNRLFERHPQKDERLKLMIATTGQGAVEKTLGAVFAVGIDPAMQRSMAGYWLHYFLPGEKWEGDAIGSRAVVAMDGAAGVPADVTAPVAEKRPEPRYTAEAERDRVQGTVQVRVVVDEDGASRRVVITRPLGYGLDAEAAEAVMRWKWRATMRDGKAVAGSVVVNQEFRLGAGLGR